MRSSFQIISAMKQNKNKGHAAFEFLSSVHSTLNKIHPFVFGEKVLFPDVKEDARLGLPFKFCSFDLMLPMRFPESCYDRYPIKSVIADSRNTPQPIDNPVLTGVIARENDDFSIDEICFWSDQSKDFSDLFNSTSRCFLMANHYPADINLSKTWIGIFLYTMSQKSSVFGSGFSPKIKRGQMPEFVKRIVFINDKKYSNMQRVSGVPIDWKHQWRVMGHWRKIADGSIGKDREGRYGISGRTWVKDCIKGEGPLIEKTRIYKGENNVRNQQSDNIGPANA